MVGTLRSWHLLLVVLGICSGCARPYYYDWGSYNRSVFRMYNEPENFVADEELEVLASEIAEARPERVPPGKAAHVGMLYAAKGDNNNARRYFEMEKRFFPESSILMTRLINRTQGKAR